MSIGALASRALDLAFPGRCVGCGQEGRPMCLVCERAVDARLELPPGAAIGLVAATPEPLLQVEWCAPFAGAVRRALHELKYGGEQRLAVPLGRGLARRWRAAGRGGDMIVPVPVHADRLRRRGYDQAALLAEVAARESGLPYAAILERTRATIAQYDLDRGSRGMNVLGAFRVRLPPGRDPSLPLAGRWPVLVDDVVTTGATLAACANALLEAGAIGVSAVTVARER